MEKSKDELPKHLLVIKDFTFTLPEDFSGSFEDAVMEFLKYRREHVALKVTNIGQDASSTEIILSDDGKNRACGAYAVCHLGEDGYYHTDQDE